MVSVLTTQIEADIGDVGEYRRLVFGREEKHPSLLRFKNLRYLRISDIL